MDILESRGVVGDKVIACVCLGCASARAPDTTGPVTAHGDVKDDLEILEVLANAAAAAEHSHRAAPARRVGVAVSDVSRDGIAREEIDFDSAGGPFGSIHTTVALSARNRYS